MVGKNEALALALAAMARGKAEIRSWPWAFQNPKLTVNLPIQPLKFGSRPGISGQGILPDKKLHLLTPDL